MAVTFVAYDGGAFGVGELWVDAGARVVVAHELPRAHTRAGHPKGTPKSPSVKLADREQRERAAFVTDVCRRLEAFFAGEPVELGDVALDLDDLSPFQRSVADALRGVPRGEVVTYGELAALAGHPGAQRAAGTFCAQNRFPVFLPCHRVVAADGIGKYGSSGVEYKRRLLALEGHAAL